jgi:hypothetical protein
MPFFLRIADIYFNPRLSPERIFDLSYGGVNNMTFIFLSQFEIIITPLRYMDITQTTNYKRKPLQLPSWFKKGIPYPIAGPPDPPSP